MIGIERLRGAVEGVDHFIELRRGEVHRVQEGTLAGAAVWIGSVGAHQQRRAVDAAGGQHVVARLDQNLAAVGGHAALVQPQAFDAGDLAAADLQLVGTRQIEQLAALVEGGRNGGDQHRLLGVGRTAHAAVAQVPAAAHIARDDFPVIAELVAAAADHIIVGIRRDGPGRDAQTLLHLLEPGRHLGGAVALHAIGLGPVLQGAFRCAEAGGPVDQGGAAHGTALHDGDGAVLAHPSHAFLIQRAVGLGFLHLEVGTGLERAFLDQQDLEAGRAEDLRGGAATGAGADDGDIGFQGQVLVQARAVVSLPATGQAFFEQIRYRHFRLSFYDSGSNEAEQVAGRYQTVGGPG